VALGGFGDCLALLRSGQLFASTTRGWERRAKLAPVLVAGTGCGGMWAITSDRRAHTLSDGSWSVVTEGALPEGRILDFDRQAGITTFVSGQRIALRAGAWRSVGEATGRVRVRVLSSWCRAPGVDTTIGETLDLPEREAAAQMALDRCVLVEDA